MPSKTCTCDADISALDFIPELDGPGDLPDQARATRTRHVLTLYGKYVALFVGAGLISGSIVHYPLDPARYLIIGAAGAALFAAASALNEVRRLGNRKRDMTLFIVASLALSLGIGMISGGIQHFQDIPARATYLIPFGIALSVASFIVRDGHRVIGRHAAVLTAVVLAFCGVLALGLDRLAGDAQANGGAAHHGGDATNGSDGHDAEAGGDPGSHAGETAAEARGGDHADAAPGNAHTEGDASGPRAVRPPTGDGHAETAPHADAVPHG